ncbi:hypothetical protein SPRG_06073, partial [Saprolegnia parasitica CBS 223.65]
MNGGIGDSPPRELYEAGSVDVDLAAHAGHSHHGDVCPTPGSCFPVPGDQFDTFADLENRLKVHSLDHGFTLARSTHLFSSTLALELFRVKSPLIKVVHRGSFYCSYKVCPDDSTKKCSWRITFTFDRTLLKYVIKNERYCAMHSHEIGEEAASSSAIHRESQLYEAELDQIQAMALQDLSIPEIRSRMQATYPGKDYTPDLLRRIVKRLKTTPPVQRPPTTLPARRRCGPSCARCRPDRCRRCKNRSKRAGTSKCTSASTRSCPRSSTIRTASSSSRSTSSRSSTR